MPISRLADARTMDRSRRLRGRIVAALFATVSLGTQTHAAGLPDPTGLWLIADERARIRVEKCGAQDAQICGFVVWMKSPLDDDGKPRVDSKNPDPKKRTRPVLGHQMMMGLKPGPDDRYRGKVYDYEEGKFVDVSVSIDDSDELEIHGCLLAILCGSQSWTRVTDVAPGQLTGPLNGPKGPRTDPEWAPKSGGPASSSKS